MAPSRLISFAIAGPGVHTINVASALPTVSDAVIIDGTSEPDFDPASGNPVIEIDGTNAGAGASGLTVGNVAYAKAPPAAAGPAAKPAPGTAAPAAAKAK